MGKIYFEEKTLTNTLLTKGFWLYLFSYIIGPIGYLTRIIISNSISVEEVGILYSILGFIGLLSAYNGLGLTQSLNYFIPKYYFKKQYDYIKTSVIWSLGVQIFTSIIIILFLYFGAEWLAINYFHSPEAEIILQYFCLYFFAVNIVQVIGSIFLSFQDTFSNKFVDFIRIFVQCILVIILFFVDMGILVNYAYIFIVGLFFQLGLGLYFFFKKYYTIFREGKLVYDRKMLSPFRKYSLRTFISMNVGVLLGMVDQQMVIVLLGPESAGYYSNYQSLLHISSVLISPIFMLLLPLFTEIFTKKDWKKLSLLQNFLYSYFSIFALSLSGLLVVLGPEIASVLFGEKFLLSGELLTISSGFFVFNTLLSINFTILASMGKVKTKTTIAFYILLVNTLLNFLLLPIIGVYGAVISTIIGWFLLWFFSFRIIQKNCQIHIERKFIFKNITIFILLGGIIYIIKDYIFIGNNNYRLGNLIYLVVIGLVWYSIIALFNGKKILFLKKEINNLRKK